MRQGFSYPQTHTQKTQFNSGLNYYKNFLAGFPACLLLSQGWISLPQTDFIPSPNCSQSRLLGNITAVDAVFRPAFRALHHVPTHFQLYLSCSLTEPLLQIIQNDVILALPFAILQNPTPATTIHTAFEKPPKLQPSQLQFLQLFNRKWRWMDRQRGSTAEYRELYSTSCDNP